MITRSHFIWFMACATVATIALGSIYIMKVRLCSDEVGVRIIRLERAITDSKKELDALKRQRDISQDTVKLSEKVGEKFRIPKPEQVTWLRLAPPLSTATLPSSNTSPRVAALDLSFRAPGEMGGPRSR